MNSFVTGTAVGTGTFQCECCGYQLTLDRIDDLLPDCTHCRGTSFVRASLFIDPSTQSLEAPELDQEVPYEDVLEHLAERQPGFYLAFLYEGDENLLRLEQECTRIGRSMTADVRLIDPTVSRRHAVLSRHEGEWVSILDDRSLNGVFVNGERVEWCRLSDGDEIVVGRFTLVFLDSMGPVTVGHRALAGHVGSAYT